MYFDYMINWIYRTMQLPVPIVTSPNVYGLVTIFDIFMFTVYIAIFIILIRYLVTDELSLRVGSFDDINYSSDMYLAKKIRDDSTKFISNIRDNKHSKLAVNQFLINRKYKTKTYNNSIAGRILAKRKAGKIVPNDEVLKSKLDKYKKRGDK